MMDGTYEYKTIRVKQRSQRALTKALNKHGRDGWELVSVGKPKWAQTKVDVVLKRRR